MGQVIPTDKGIVFAPGAMAWIVNQLVEGQLNYSPLERYEAGEDTVRFVDETELCKKIPLGRKIFLSGIKHGKGNAFYARNAQILGLLALQLQRDKKEPVVAVLFRDTDNSRSAPRNIWQAKVYSITRGFESVDFPHGVAMMPLPKSEAWLICALKDNPYCNCESLEEKSGNDSSPNSLKKQLEKLTGHDPSAEEQAEWVRTGKIDPEKINMPSYDAFRETLHVVLEKVKQDSA